MRRSEKEIGDVAAVEQLLRSEPVVHLSMIAEGEPYVVPMFFGYTGRKLFLHSARAGRKIDAMHEHPRVGFSVSATPEVTEGKTACNFGARYRSVCGTGRVRFIEDPDEKRVALDTIMNKFGPGEHTYEDDALGKTAVICVEIESMAGKQSGY